MVYVNRPAIVIVKGSARDAMRAPMRVLDRPAVVMMVIVRRRHMDVRRRQRRGDNGRGRQQRGSERPSEAAGNHAGILAQ